MEFTSAQKSAIELRDRNILVSAAAGSGKTATLTERIIRLITDKNEPSEIDSMLIVTFTRAAAGELRTRISKALSNVLASDPSNVHVAKQLTALGGAKICTIDAYYFDLVRANFQKLDLPAKFRLADETELSLLREEIMNSVIERRYRYDIQFVEYADQITTAKGEGKLSDTLLQLALKITTVPHGTDILSSCALNYSDCIKTGFFDSNIGKVFYSSLYEELEYLQKRCDRLISLIDLNAEAAVYGKAVSADLDFISELMEVLAHSDYAAVRQKVYDYSAVSLGRISSANKSEISEEIKSERNEIKDRLIQLKSHEFYAHPDDLPKMAKISADFCLKTKEILDDYFSSYTNEKSARCICEFSDLRKYVLELLIDSDGQPTAIAEEEKNKFKHIFVDEYQDTDSIQDLVFQTISNGKNLFFVGDIKQSIYSFRGAEPSLFSNYRKKYLPVTGRTNIPNIPLSIFMSDNFRCSPNIISFTNCVCSYLFRESEGPDGGIGYVAEDDLIASRPAPISNDKVRVVLLEKSPEDDESDIESQFVISEIKRLLNSGIKPDGTKYKPSDIAILTRSNKEAMSIADSLGKAGIAHANSTGNDLFENQEVLLMLALLTAADNPQRDIPLTGALRSPIFGFTLSDLINVKHNKQNMSLYDAINVYCNDTDAEPTLREKCKNTIKKLEEYRDEAEAMPVHLFMRYIWRDTNALTYAGSDVHTRNRTPIERRRNLRKFYEYAREFESSSFKGLHQFIEYVNGIIARGTKITDEDAVTDNTIQIMTVHKSKGLEFPVVFIVGCDKMPNEQDSRQPIIFTSSNELGLACKVTDSTGFAQLDTPFRVTLSKKVSELSADEEIRVLYVALTRARDLLYIVASGKEGFSEKRISGAMRKASIGGRHTILNAPRWIEKILIGLASNPTNTSFIIETPDITQFISEKSDEKISFKIDECEVKRICDTLRPSLQFHYQNNDSSEIPAKLSVSKLYPELLNDTHDSTELLIKAENLEKKKPRFLGVGSNAADKGTATHLFLQFCNFDNLSPTKNSVANEISRLVSEKYITQDIADLIRINELVKFASSSIIEDLKHAQKLYRELRFNIFLPASHFTTDNEKKQQYEDNEVLVQGVIDLCFINSNNELILCDYKTDRLSQEMLNSYQLAKKELTLKHGQQLKYYSYAIESIFGRTPDKILIYSLAYGDAIEIDL